MLHQLDSNLYYYTIPFKKKIVNYYEKEIIQENINEKSAIKKQ